jgi:excinuclease ABC subunit C
MLAIKTIIEKQTVINDLSEKDQDAVSFYGDERGVLVETLHIRSGRVIGNRPHFIPGINPNSPDEDPREWLASFLNQYYADNYIPDDVLLSVDLGNDIHRLLQDVLKERSGQNVVVRFATDAKGQDLIEMASQNAKAHFEKQLSKDEEKKKGLDEIQSKLNLPKRPNRIECFDISHFQGSETVASQVVFEDGVPAKEHYRRYKIKTVQRFDDFASMYEVLKRRFGHDEYEEPQLIVVDGGKGQLSQAVKILQELNKMHIPVVGLAKARTEANFQAEDVSGTEERFYLPGRANPVVFKTNTEAFQILTGLRDEAHRFAITFHRERREKTSLESELDYIVGLGEKRKKLLLLKFKTIDEIREADVETIAELKTFNRVLAERILLQLNEAEEKTDLKVDKSGEV